MNGELTAFGSLALLGAGWLFGVNGVLAALVVLAVFWIGWFAGRITATTDAAQALAAFIRAGLRDGCAIEDLLRLVENTKEIRCRKVHDDQSR